LPRTEHAARADRAKRGKTICYLAALMSKKFTKRKQPAPDPAAATPEQKLLERQRFLAARALRKRRQRKSHQ